MCYNKQHRKYEEGIEGWRICLVLKIHVHYYQDQISIFLSCVINFLLFFPKGKKDLVASVRHVGATLSKQLLI